MPLGLCGMEPLARKNRAKAEADELIAGYKALGVRKPRAKVRGGTPRGTDLGRWLVFGIFE